VGTEKHPKGETDRYARISELGWNREVLCRLHCLVVGAGALGNEVIKNLALLGVGKIVIVDMDTIDNTNLTRSVLFRQSDIGKYKAEVAAARAREIDSAVNAVSVVGKFQDRIGDGAFFAFDVVFGCLDSIQARIDLSRASFQANVLYIDAGLRGIDGDLKIFGKRYEVCYDCLLSDEQRKEAWRTHSCLRLRTTDSDRPSGPTAPTISSIVAGLQVQLAVKYAHGKPIPFNHRMAIHGNIDDFSVVRLSRNSQCPTHHSTSVIPVENLVPLSLTSNESTCRQLLLNIKDDLGPNAEIDLGFDLVDTAQCAKHNYTRTIMKKRGWIYVEEMLCPYCLAEGCPKVESIMTDSSFNQIVGNESFLDKTICEIGYAPKSIIRAHSIHEGHIRMRTYVLNDQIL